MFHSDKPSLKTRIWVITTLLWLFGVADRAIVVWLKEPVSIAHLVQLLIAFALFLGWLLLKPLRV
ncbi:MAG TPA: hypothetical protein ACFE0H_04650 [Elainellaceae cyanobacterium]